MKRITDLVQNWEYIKGFEGKYSVNIYGNVWSYPDPRKYGAKGKQLAESVHKNGSVYVTLFKDGKPQRRYVHKLVAETFMANPHNFKCIRHLDGDKKNNHVVNLEWVNSSILQRKPKSTELPPTLCKSFVKKLKALHGREIREMKVAGMNVAQIMKKFNASRYQVEACLYGTASELKELERWKKRQEKYGKDSVPDDLFSDLLEYLPREVNAWGWKRDEALLHEHYRQQYGEDWESVLEAQAEAAKCRFAPILEELRKEDDAWIRRKWNVPAGCDPSAYVKSLHPENWNIEKMAAEFAATGKITSTHSDCKDDDENL